MNADAALDTVLTRFDGLTLGNPALRVASRRAGEGLLTTAEVQRAAGISGNRLGEFLVDALTDLAGDGQLTSADALTVVPPALRSNYKFVSSLLNGLDQKGALRQAIPAFDAERAENLAHYMAGYERFSDHRPEVVELVENNIRSIVDESERQTADARYRMGMKPTITRSCVGETCQWCADLAGSAEYNPATMNRDIFRRHRACDCLIELNRDGGREVVNNYVRANRDTGSAARRARIADNTLASGEEKSRGKDVTAGYFGKAKPGEGEITKEKGFKPGNKKREEPVARLLHETFGGDIKLLGKDEKNPCADFLWKGKLWELKTPDTPVTNNAVNRNIRTALHQTHNNPGGIILELLDNDYSVNNAVKEIDYRVSRSGKSAIDVMILQGGRVDRVLRYKK